MLDSHDAIATPNVRRRMKKQNDRYGERFLSTRTLLVSAVFSLLVWATPALAAKPSEAAFVEQRPRLITLEAGRALTVELLIKNLSGHPWQASGAKALEVRLVDGSPGELRHRWWKDRTVARLRAPVKSRKVATLRIPLRGPESGYYEETLSLYEGNRRVPGSTVSLSAVVGPTDRRQLLAAVPPEVTVTMTAGSEQHLPVTVTNQGIRPWKNRGYGRVRLNPVDESATSQFRSQRWLGPKTVAMLSADRVATDETIELPLPVRAPAVPGTYTEEYRLTATGIGPIPGGRLRVSITVLPIQPIVSPTEPVVRIGLFAMVDDPNATIKATGPAKLTTTDGTVLLESVGEVTLSKEGVGYRYLAGEATGLSPLPLRVEAPATTILEITDWENRPSWDPTLNDNLVRGTVEFRTVPNGKTWFMNELPIESYLLGLAETSARSPLEFRKVIMTAARTYALHHNAKKTKHAEEFYDINVTTDQVYRGYGHEVRSPSVREAVEATRGMVLFHPAAQSEANVIGIILAAYSACTDGRTRSFEEVFGGNGSKTPYLVSVPDPDGICVNPRYLKGLDGNHMVGISGNGGIAMAKAGKTYDQILTYFYTGVMLAKYYE